jgi:hypothetical protein
MDLLVSFIIAEACGAAVGWVRDNQAMAAVVCKVCVRQPDGGHADGGHAVAPPASVS